MMSRTGTKRLRGFTLVEVMVTAAVLAFGVVAIYQALFITLEAFSYCADYLYLVPQIDEKVWETQDTLRTSGSESHISLDGQFVGSSRLIPWKLSYYLVDQDKQQYKIDISCKWKAGKREVSLARSAYAQYEKSSDNVTQE